MWIVSSSKPGSPSPYHRAWTLAGFLAVVGVVAGLALLPGGEPGTSTPARDEGVDRAAPPAALRGAGGDVDTSPARPTVQALTAFEAAMVARDSARAPAAAAALRKAIRTSPAAWSAVVERLLAADTPTPIRRALAWVLGTVSRPDPDAALLEVLQAFGDDPESVRFFVLALAAVRDPWDDDEVFALGERPYGESGPAGMGITVRRPVEKAEVRAALAGQLVSPSTRVRRAAVVALAASVRYDDAREALVQTLRTETEDEVAEVLGEAIVAHARQAKPDSRADVLDLVIQRAGDHGLDGYRFRMENDLQEVPLSTNQRRQLMAYAQPDQAFGTRAFALTVLVRGAVAGGPAAVTEIRTLLHGVLADDADAAARDLAARLARELPATMATREALARAVRKDPAWNVRFSSLESLVRLGRSPSLEAALGTARDDPDARVAALAAKAQPTSE